MKKLIKSYKFWTSLAGAVGLLFALISEHIGLKIDAEGIKEIIMAFCGVLIVFGIVKKPNNSQKLEEIDLTENSVSFNNDEKELKDDNI